jgi:TonB-dependent SusC/RagA subfamily outer membrane receptor
MHASASHLHAPPLRALPPGSLIRALVLVPCSIAVLAACARSSDPKTSDVSVAPPPDRSAPAVSSEDIARTPSEPIEKLLMSRTPGIYVFRAGDGSLAIRIRGASSLQGNNEPLIVIDGVPVDGAQGGVLTGLNPYDIASIRVLKDPADITMYGVRGANGVILITTKRNQ